MFHEIKSIGASDNSVFVVYDHRAGATGAYIAEQKGQVEWVVEAICNCLETWGCGDCRITIKSDRENAVDSAREAIAQAGMLPIAIFDSPVRESKSNGDSGENKLTLAVAPSHNESCCGRRLGQNHLSKMQEQCVVDVDTMGCRCSEQMRIGKEFAVDISTHQLPKVSPSREEIL